MILSSHWWNYVCVNYQAVVKAAPPPAVKAVSAPPPARPQGKMSNLPAMMPPPGTHGVRSDVCAPSKGHGPHGVLTDAQRQCLWHQTVNMSVSSGSAKTEAQDEVSQQVIAKRLKFWLLLSSKSSSRGSSSSTSSSSGSSSSNRGSSSSSTGTKYVDEVTKYAEEVTYLSEEPAQPPPSPPPPERDLWDSAPVEHTEPQGFWSPFMNCSVAVPDAAVVPLPADMDKDRLARRIFFRI